ncbi:MAG: hypothetical protein IPH07_35140 [Deltaproteobacteria bacterium]|nr:hypothetical protein [Deltaproteobacteria bacterium]MBK8716261.1 hypothetical protein [Deltaproteobacteria bacterium]MBP7292069.1 hypothetical protein [Nannocystaceae bacterium]
MSSWVAALTAGCALDPTSAAEHEDEAEHAVPGAPDDGAGELVASGDSQPFALHYVDVDADGAFDPPSLTIGNGHTVVWRFHDRYDSIVRIGSPAAACDPPAPYSDDPSVEFTGPMPVAPGGVFALNPSPDSDGLVMVDARLALDRNDPCGADEDRGQYFDFHLCARGEPGTTMMSTWEDPGITGVYLRLAWSDINPGAGVYDFSILDREVDRAVRHGKLYSLSIEAGRKGTPDWIFDTNAREPGSGNRLSPPIERPNGGGGVPRLTFEDQGSHPDEPGDCGASMDLGAPFDDRYQDHYFGMLSAVADHLKARVDWYRALAYVKPSGANLFTAENRLPKECDPDCVCNPEVWANAGYRPRYLYEFYERQLAELAAAFPGKTMVYQLIQAGFPRINGAGGYVDADGQLTAGLAEIGGTEQTETILERSIDAWGLQFAVQHAGLQPKPTAICPGGDGCPQQLVVDAGAAGQITAFQTQNIHEIADLVALDSTLRNARDNSEATMIEIYEELLWQSQRRGGGVLDVAGSNQTLGEWDEALRERRAGRLPETDAGPIDHAHRFTNPGVNELTVYYVHGSKCDPDAPVYGQITVRP